MRFPTALLTLFLTLVVANASSHIERALTARHLRISAARSLTTLGKRDPPKRCKSKKNSSSSKKPEPTSKKHGPASTKSADKSTKAPAPEKTPTSAPKPHEDGSSGGKVLVATSKCGGSRAVEKPSSTSGPNGDIDFLNCGLDGSGWNPPFVGIDDVIVKDLSEAIKSPDSPFKACAPYVKFFNKYGNEHGIPPIFLASFAMQESSCNPEEVGGAGEQGLMQITKEKCGGAPGGNCRDVDFNIRVGAKYFADTLAKNNGNVLKTIAEYDGWHQGLTVEEATAARWTSCCRCQQNLDYLQQFLNGWCQNIDAYQHHLGKYFNLDDCQ